MPKWGSVELATEATTIERLTTCAAIAKCFSSAGQIGAKAKWRAFGGDAALGELRSRELEIRDEAERQLDAARRHRVRLVGAILGRWVLDSARARALDGTVEFHDLRVLARRLVSTQPEIRAALHER